METYVKPTHTITIEVAVSANSQQLFDAVKAHITTMLDNGAFLSGKPELLNYIQVHQVNNKEFAHTICEGTSMEDEMREYFDRDRELDY